MSWQLGLVLKKMNQENKRFELKMHALRCIKFLSGKVVLNLGVLNLTE